MAKQDASLGRAKRKERRPAVGIGEDVYDEKVHTECETNSL